MESKEVVRGRLMRDGYTKLVEYDDPPNEVFPDHTHEGDQYIVILKGSITITMLGKTTVMKPGDEMFFPKQTIHSAVVGPEGCVYIDGEKE